MIKNESTGRRMPALVATILLGLPASAFAQITLPADPPPIDQFASRVLHQPPALTGEGATAKRSVLAFLSWAGMSAPAEREDGRLAIAAASANNEIAKALCQEANKAKRHDNSRALLVLAVLGELRNPLGEACLRHFLALPLPKGGRVDRETGESELAEMLEMQQAKAVDGLAYRHNEGADAVVLDAISHHPSRAVRAEAIAAYLWNHGETADARSIVARAVQPGEDVFLDRVRRDDNEEVASFDAKIDAFLRAHPERAGDAPDPVAPAAKTETPTSPGAAPSDGFVFGYTCGSTAPTCGGTCPTGQSCASDPLAGCKCN